MIRLARAGALAALVALFASGHATADTIHLQNGGTIRTDHWWLDGDSIVYDGPAGSVGIPRSIVVRIEPSAEEPARSAGTREPSKPERVAPPLRGLDATQAGELRDRLADASAAFARREFETAAERFRSAYEAEPGLAGARLGYAISEMALGRNERALPVVLEGLSLDPGSAELHEVLGDLRDAEEQVEDAVRSWKEAFRLGPNDRLRGKIFKAERELTAGRDYAFSAAPHFNLRYDGSLDPDLATDVAEHLEASYRELSDLFRHAPPQPITVLLYPERQFRDVTQAPESVAGLFDGKIRVPLGGIRAIDERARRVLVHELTHAVLHSKTRGSCPRWLHEGLAQRSEGKSVGRADLDAIRRSLRDREPSSWESAGFSYPAALSLTLHLEHRRGIGAIVDLLDRLGQGSALEAALRETFGQSYEEICRDWAEQLQSETRP